MVSSLLPKKKKRSPLSSAAELIKEKCIWRRPSIHGGYRRSISIEISHASPVGVSPKLRRSLTSRSPPRARNLSGYQFVFSPLIPVSFFEFRYQNQFFWVLITVLYWLFIDLKCADVFRSSCPVLLNRNKIKILLPKIQRLWLFLVLSLLLLFSIIYCFYSNL